MAYDLAAATMKACGVSAAEPRLQTPFALAPCDKFPWS